MIEHVTNKIVHGMREAVAYAKGEPVRVRKAQVPVITGADVRRIRRRLALSQDEFALRFGFSVGSVRNWEQGHRQPEGPARAFLKVIESEPEAVQRALSAR